eukprot:12184472-Karenia_brevis.AAC.1
MHKQITDTGYAYRKVAWRGEGHSVCRHGVFFLGEGARSCNCLSTEALAEYQACSDVKYMVSLSHELKALVVKKFNCQEFRRLGILQAELRRRQW